MKRESTEVDGDEEERRSEELTTCVEWEFAERFEEKAEVVDAAD